MSATMNDTINQECATQECATQWKWIEPNPVWRAIHESGSDTALVSVNQKKMSATMNDTINQEYAPEWQELNPVWRATHETGYVTADACVKQKKISATMFDTIKHQRAAEWQEPSPVWRATQETCYDTAAASVKQYELSRLSPRSDAIMNNKITIETSYSNDEECSICLFSMLNEPVIHTPCRHAFHLECFDMQHQYQLNNKKSKEIKCAECQRNLYESTKTMNLPKKTKKIQISQV